MRAKARTGSDRPMMMHLGASPSHSPTRKPKTGMAPQEAVRTHARLAAPPIADGGVRAAEGKLAFERIYGRTTPMRLLARSVELWRMNGMGIRAPHALLATALMNGSIEPITTAIHCGFSCRHAPGIAGSIAAGWCVVHPRVHGMRPGNGNCTYLSSLNTRTVHDELRGRPSGRRSCCD